jgi:hypothetical protein
LVIRVRVDDDVGSVFYRGLQTGDESGRQPDMLWDANNVMNAGFLCDLKRVIRAAVVYHQILDCIHIGDAPGQCLYRLWQGFSLVVARNLDD